MFHFLKPSSINPNSNCIYYFLPLLFLPFVFFTFKVFVLYYPYFNANWCSYAIFFNMVTELKMNQLLQLALLYCNLWKACKLPIVCIGSANFSDLAGLFPCPYTINLGILLWTRLKPTSKTKEKGNLCRVFETEQISLNCHSRVYPGLRSWTQAGFCQCFVGF